MYWRIWLCCALAMGGVATLKSGGWFEPGQAGAKNPDGVSSEDGASSQEQAPSPSERASFYMAIYAYQTAPNKARFSHTFATFVRASADRTTSFEAKTISWMPKSLNIVLLRRGSEAGVNLDLHQSMELGLSHGARISQWGPFQVKAELYERALAQIDRLNSGTVGYKALDRDQRPGSACNCIHAVSDLDTDDGMLNTGAERGDVAAAMVVNHLRRWIIDPDTTHPWVSERLNPDGKYPIAQR